MRVLAVAAIAVLVAGCAQRLAVAPIEVASEPAYLENVSQCKAAAEAYKPEVTVGSVIYGAVAQGLGVISYAILYPWMPVLGAAGGAGRAATDGYDITGRIRANVFRHCMVDKSARDRSAILANPDD